MRHLHIARMFHVRPLLKRMGPGIITGAADDDPSGVVTYSQIGASFGNKYLWTAIWIFPFMFIVQEICARIALATKQGLTGVLKRVFPRWMVLATVLLVVFANIVNIGADLQAIVVSTQLLVTVPSWILYALYLVGIAWGVVFLSYEATVRVLKWFSLFLLAYAVTAMVSVNGLDGWRGVIASALTPSLELSRNHIMILVAVLGTTISPYLFFWQSSEEVEDLANRRSVKPKTILSQIRFDTVFGMFASNLAMFFIILTASANLHAHGITNVATAADAAAALEPFAGRFASLLFTGGIIGTGLLAIPVLAGANAYALAEMFGWRGGLHLKWWHAKRFYGVIVISMLLGLGVLLLPWSPMETLVYTATLLGCVAPWLLGLIMVASGKKSVMGEFKNGTLSTLGGWLTVVLLTGACIALFVS